MTHSDFVTLCELYLICPEVALENDNVVATLLGMRRTTDSNAYNGYRNSLTRTFATEF